MKIKRVLFSLIFGVVLLSASIFISNYCDWNNTSNKSQTQGVVAIQDDNVRGDDAIYVDDEKLSDAKTISVTSSVGGLEYTYYDGWGEWIVSEDGTYAEHTYTDYVDYESVTFKPPKTYSPAYNIKGWEFHSTGEGGSTIYSNEVFSVIVESITSISAIWEEKGYIRAEFDYADGKGRNLFAEGNSQMESYMGAYEWDTSTWVAFSEDSGFNSFEIRKFKGTSAVETIASSLSIKNAVDGYYCTFEKSTSWDHLQVYLYNSSDASVYSYFFADCTCLDNDKEYALSFYAETDSTNAYIRNISIEKYDADYNYDKDAPLRAPRKTITKTSTFGTLPILESREEWHSFSGWADANAYNKSSLIIKESSDNYNYESLVSDIVEGDELLVSIDEIDIIGGAYGYATILLYDFTGSEILTTEEIYIGRNKSVKLICPTTTSDDVQLLIYAGCSGYTENVRLEAKGVRVAKVRNSVYVGSSSTVKRGEDYFLIPNWSLNKYTITYSANGGIGTMEDQHFYYGNDCNLRNNAFSKLGYTFTGFATIASDGTGKGVPQTYTALQLVEYLGYKEHSNVTIELKAQWTPNPIKVNIYVQDTQGVMTLNGTRNINRVAGKTLESVANDLGCIVDGGITYGYSTKKPINYFMVDNEDNLVGDYSDSGKSWCITYTETKPTYGGNDDYISFYWRDNGEIRYVYVYMKTPGTLKQTFAYDPAIPYNIGFGGYIRDVMDNSGDSKKLIIRTEMLEVGKEYTLSFDYYAYETGLDISNLCIKAVDDEGGEISSIADDGVMEIDMYLNRDQHSIAFNPNGGIYEGSTETSTSSGYYYEGVYTLGTATRAGYTFNGWEITSGDATVTETEGVYKIAIGTTDVELKALWTPTSNVIHFDEAEGEEIADGTYYTSDSEQRVQLPTEEQMTRKGYRFTGWVCKEGIEYISVEDGQTLVIPAGEYRTAYLNATWEAISYDITIENGEGTATPSTYTINNSSDQTISLTPTTKSGYTFAGWETDRESDQVSANNDTNVLTIKAGVVGNIIVKALWNPLSYTITWIGNPENNTDIMLTQSHMWNYAGVEGYTSDNMGSKSLYTLDDYRPTSSVRYGQILDYYTPIPVIAGYTFGGWYTDVSGAGVMVADAFGNWVANVEGYTDSYKQWLCAQNTMLYAYYTATEYAIAYDYVGGVAGTNPETYSITESQSITDPTKTGYTFAGWEVMLMLNKQNKGTLLSNGAQQYSADTPNAVLYDILYIKNGVTYSGTTYNDEISWINYTSSSISTLSSEKSIEGSGVYVANYYPNGNPDDAVYVSLDIPSGGFTTSNYNLMGKLLLKAKWTINQYKLTINPNGGIWNSLVSNSDVIADYGTQIAIASPIRTGYEFDGWTFSGDGDWYGDTGIYVYSAGNGSLTANWKAKSPTITISAVPNDNAEQTTIVYGNSVVFTAVAKHDLAITYQWYCGTTQGFDPSLSTEIANTLNQTTYTHESKSKDSGIYYYKCKVTSAETGMSTVSNEIKLIVDKAENVFDVDVKAKLIYNGEEQTLLTVSDINDECDIYYSVQNNETGERTNPSTEVPKATEAGIYIVYFNTEETKNYKALEGSATVEIEQLYTKLIIDPAGGEWNNTTEKSEFRQLTGHTQNIADPTRLGSNFTGWTISGTGTWDETNKTFTYGMTDTTLTATWNAIEYKILIDENKGIAVDDLKYLTGETEKELPVLTREGYEFREWSFVEYSNPVATIEGNKLMIPANATGDMEIRAEWQGKTATISYNLNNGNWKDGYNLSQDQTQYTTTESETSINLPTIDNIERAGYEFAGWEIATNNTCGNATITGASKTVLVIPADSYGDIELKATWEGVTYNITYDTNGGEFALGYNPTKTYTTQESQEFIVVSLPTATYISRGGYNFAGWLIVTNSNGSSNISGNSLSIPANAYGDIALKATWESAINNIEYDTNEGTWQKEPASAQKQYMTSESSQEMSLPTSDDIKREGYTFDGWKIVTGYNSKPTGSTLSEDKLTLNIPANDYVDKNNVLKLEAQWTINSYKLTIDYAYDGKENDTVTQNYGTTYTPETPERAGYNFNGWALTGGGKLQNGVYTFGSADGTLTAQWAIKQYTLTVKPNGGKWANGTNPESEADEPITQNYGTSLQINDPTRYGYTFSGWALESADGGVANGLFNSEDKLYTFGAGNDTLTAQWTVKQFVFTRDLNLDDDFDITTYPYEDAVRRYTQDYNTIKEHGPYEREGYTFVEWRYEGDGVFEQLEDGGYRYLFLGDGFATAVWEENSYTITLDYQGGTVSYLDTDFTNARDYTYDIYELSEDFDPTLTGGDGSAGWELGIHTDYAAGYINLEDGTGFNGDRSLNVRVDQMGEKTYQRRISYALNGTNYLQENGKGLGLGTYQLGMYLKVNTFVKEFKIHGEGHFIDAGGNVQYPAIYYARYYNLNPDVWYYIQIKFNISDEASSFTNLMLYLGSDTHNEDGTIKTPSALHQIDDLKLVRLTDETGNAYDVTKDTENPVTKVEFEYSTELRLIPNAVKAGYTFLGWNDKADGSGNWATHYAGYKYFPREMISPKYYAIYKLSNPTATLSNNPLGEVADNANGGVAYDKATPTHTMEYNKDSVTLTANVSTEGLVVDKTNYQWHVSTTPNFTPSSDTLISGANARTYTHSKTFKGVGTYYYRCVVSVEKDGVKTDSIASDYAIVEVTKGTASANISMDDYIYGETPSVPRSVSNISGGTLTYYYNTTRESTGGTEWKNIAPTTLNAGTYYMYATIAETANFKAGVSNVVEFNVNSKEITKPTVTSEYIYNRTEQTVIIQGFDATKMEVVDGDKATEAGTYTVTIALLDKTNYNYSWDDGVAGTYGTTQDLVLTWTINPYDVANVTIADVVIQSFINADIEPKPDVIATELENYKLIEGVDFDFSYENNRHVGTATLTITGKGNYTGTQSKEFEIKGALLDKPTITSTYKYNATEQEVTIDGFDSEGMTVVAGSVTKATNAGKYSVTIKLNEYYTWSDLSRDNITLEWEIAKADVTLTPSQTSMSIRVGERLTNEIAVATSYGGSIDGQNLSSNTPPKDADMDITTIVSNKSTFSIIYHSFYRDSEKISINYKGDGNHNDARAEIELTIIPLYVELKINGSGTAVISSTLGGSGNKYSVGLNSDITFTARPEANNGLIKYSIQNITNYMEKTSSRKLTDSFTSDTITVSDTLLGNTGNSVANDTITIELWFDKVVNITLNTDATNTGAIETKEEDISTKYEDKNVNFEYNSTTKELIAFESAELSVNVKAKKLDEQYYIINKITIGATEPQNVKALDTTITTTVEDLSEDANISVQAVKVFNAEEKEVSDKSAKVGSVKVDVNAVYAFEIEDEVYVIENSPVDIQITTNNSNYDFLAIKVNGVVMLKGQFEGSWEHNGDVSKWKAQQYTKEISQMEAIILEKWYTSGDTSKVVEVEVDEGIDAKLINTDIGYSYTLADNIFNVAGSESLYVGNWKVHIESANVTNYEVKVTIQEGTSPEVTYGKDETFKINSNVTKVIIKITAVQ